MADPEGEPGSADGTVAWREVLADTTARLSAVGQPAAEHGLRAAEHAPDHRGGGERSTFFEFHQRVLFQELKRVIFRSRRSDVSRVEAGP